MEKLIVKNFGPIKEAEIDLTKYVVFIGDTSTGKSVLAKLISIFRDFVNLIKNKVNDFDYEKELDFNNQLKNYNIDFNFDDSIFEYYNLNLYLLLNNNKIINIKDTHNKRKFNDITNFPHSFSNDDLIKIYSIIGNRGKSIYFPPERILTSLIGGSLSGLWANNVALPICFKNFAAKYEVARTDLNSTYSYIDFGFEYNFLNGEEIIYNSGLEFKLSKASSGIQSMLPLLIVFDNELRLEVFKPDLNFLIEEPELNLFPIKQKKLIDYLISRVSDSNHKIIFTTHSPYILSAIDTLVLAKNTFNEHPEFEKEINSIISKNKWIDYNEISVYEVKKDGKVYSIKNEEFKSIDANTIDSVSDIISEEFDKLTSLRYAQ
jgi:predicted ATP-dependent endonuclease of OLD family